MFCDGTLLSTVTLLLAQREISPRFLKFVWKRLQPTWITPGSWLSISGFSLPVHSWFCPDPQFVLDAQRSGLFPYLFLLFFIGFFNYYFGCRSVNYLFPIIDSLTISGKYSKKENRGFAAVQGLISYYLTVIYQIMNF